MKLKFRKKEDSGSLKKAVSNFNAAMDQLSCVLVERNPEIRALSLALVSREHLMLEGVAGVAKSRFAREAFMRIKGATSFRKQFTSTTQPDEVMGCMDSKLYRDQAIWKYNVKGMLPDCHLAFLDEVYRAAKSFLSNTMQVLNERTFYNGTEEISCPLITAVGTTNFIINDEELDAFHDRWLIKSSVQRLGSAHAKITLLEKYVNELCGNQNFEVLKTVSLTELELIQAAADEVVIPRRVLEVYEELVRVYLNLEKHVTVSDRRLCQTLKLVQAAYVLDESENKAEEVNENYLSAVQNGITSLNDEKQTSSFGQAFQKIVGELVQEQEVSRKLKRLVRNVMEMESEFDEGMPEEDAKEMYIKTSRYLGALTHIPHPELPKAKESLESLNGSKNRLESLKKSLQGVLCKAIEKEVEQELSDE